MANNNVLNLDKFQLTMIKRNYGIIKPIIAKREKAQKKIDDKQRELDELKASLQAEINTYNDQISALDAFTLTTTKQACGIELSSEQALNFIENPEEFEVYKEKIGLKEAPAGEEEQPEYNENIGEANAAIHDM